MEWSEVHKRASAASEWSDGARAELSRLGDAADVWGDYRRRDELSADHGETAWEHLEGLAAAVLGAGPDPFVIGVIEWASDSGAEPSVYYGTPDAVRMAAVRELSAQVSAGYVEYVDPADLPAPDFDDPEAVSAWLSALRDMTTDGWFSVFTPSDRVRSDTFHDLRGV